VAFDDFDGQRQITVAYSENYTKHITNCVYVWKNAMILK
jgi:hypothetical protein